MTWDAAALALNYRAAIYAGSILLAIYAVLTQE